MLKTVSTAKLFFMFGLFSFVLVGAVGCTPQESRLPDAINAYSTPITVPTASPDAVVNSYNKVSTSDSLDDLNKDLKDTNLDDLDNDFNSI